MLALGMTLTRKLARFGSHTYSADGQLILACNLVTRLDHSGRVSQFALCYLISFDNTPASYVYSGSLQKTVFPLTAFRPSLSRSLLRSLHPGIGSILVLLRIASPRSVFCRLFALTLPWRVDACIYLLVFTQYSSAQNTQPTYWAPTHSSSYFVLNIHSFFSRGSVKRSSPSPPSHFRYCYWCVMQSESVGFWLLLRFTFSLSVCIYLASIIFHLRLLSISFRKFFFENFSPLVDTCTQAYISLSIS